MNYALLSPQKVNPIVQKIKVVPKELCIALFCELDEQWSFIQKKKEQRWLWSAWSPQLKQVLAYHLGKGLITVARNYSVT